MMIRSAALIIRLTIMIVNVTFEKSVCIAYSFEQLPRTVSAIWNNKAESVSRRAFFQSSSVVSVSALILTDQSRAAVAALVVSDNIPTIGVKAPSFELPNSLGTGKTSLEDLIASKKWTVLYFYPGAFSQGCTLQARGFQRDIDKYRALDTQIVGISVDSVEKNAQFCSSEGLDFYMLTDEGGVVSKAYGSSLTVPGSGSFSNRQTYLIDPSGNLRWVFMDVESRVPRHSAEVLEKLAELQKSA
mmetsp:Transcript_6830/g.9942  ORF Transcript_6830/g.9942 Transcript_6830/m.9942 type:complete len:244 (+) Transcript_6830:77-808(+)|eukprot:CAMPEP_0172427270 /NCGR_PEP_ID=MMETSP1064-20121228/41371_1 /TAXON_ID=202472 /ORGANISM="Aulacoseira subarctica , Strain CCAP 1002/5" /LENGTH=243 /DNA_ID=CAMNT_0013171397 /DNA_START=50 /DNA_END=781 /DNA_ORIENTATION=+